MTLFGTEEPPGEEDIPEPPKPPAPPQPEPEHEDVLTAFQHLLDKLF
jgi:hypothetical protein